MALLFSFSLAMDMFVIGRVVTTIDYPSIQFSIKLAVATVVALLAKFRCSHAAEGSAVHKSTGTALTTRPSSFSMAVLSWQHSLTRGCTAPRECAIGRSYRFAEKVATNPSREEALVAPIDTKVSIDTIVQ
jgi:hypothetical protein